MVSEGAKGLLILSGISVPHNSRQRGCLAITPSPFRGRRFDAPYVFQVLLPLRSETQAAVIDGCKACPPFR